MDVFADLPRLRVESPLPSETIFTGRSQEDQLLCCFEVVEEIANEIATPIAKAIAKPIATPIAKPIAKPVQSLKGKPWSRSQDDALLRFFRGPCGGQFETFKAATSTGQTEEMEKEMRRVCREVGGRTRKGVYSRFLRLRQAGKLASAVVPEV